AVTAVAPAGEAEGIGVAQLRLGEEWEPSPVLRPLHVLRARAAEATGVRGVAERALERRPHALEDEPLERLTLERFELGLPHRQHGHHPREPAEPAQGGAAVCPRPK